MILTVRIRHDPSTQNDFELIIDEYDVSVVCRDMDNRALIGSVLDEIRQLIRFKQELDDHFLNIGGNNP